MSNEVLILEGKGRAKGTRHEGKMDAFHALGRHTAAKGLAALPQKHAKQ